MRGCQVAAWGRGVGARQVGQSDGGRGARGGLGTRCTCLTRPGLRNSGGTRSSPAGPSAQLSVQSFPLPLSLGAAEALQRRWARECARHRRQCCPAPARCHLPGAGVHTERKQLWALCSLCGHQKRDLRRHEGRVKEVRAVGPRTSKPEPIYASPSTETPRKPPPRPQQAVARPTVAWIRAGEAARPALAALRCVSIS